MKSSRTPLASNGGFTQTHELLPGSPALNRARGCRTGSGLQVDTDQRGFPRPHTPCDIGAYEREILLLTPTQNSLEIGEGKQAATAVSFAIRMLA